MPYPKSTLWLADSQNEACSGLDLRGASLFLPLKEAPDAAECVKFKPITFFRSIKEKKQPSFSIFRVECLTLKNSNFFK